MGLVLFVGCNFGPADQPDTGRVSGTVTLDGSPLADAKVTFQPQSGRPSAGVTGADGTYTLMYTKDVEGAKVGENTVSIIKPDEKFDSDGELISSKETVPAKYNKKSELKETVEPGENTINFDLKSK